MRRAIAVVVALALAGLGTFFLVRFVQSAENRALEGEVLTSVLVVDTPITAGTRAEDLTGQVRLEEVPAKVLADGAVSDLASLTGKVAAIRLLPGEQIVSSRFVTPDEYSHALTTAGIEPPANLLQVALSLSPERVVGGQVSPGDVVAVFASFEPFPLNTLEPTGLTDREIAGATTTTLPGQQGQANAGLQSPTSTKIILHNVLVTNLQAEQLPRQVSQEDMAAGAVELAPTGNLLITLALEPAAAERLVFAAEHGSVWLAVEGAEVRDADTAVQTRRTVYEAQ
jgi:pilus assembly protein CpaB